MTIAAKDAVEQRPADLKSQPLLLFCRISVTESTFEYRSICIKAGVGAQAGISTSDCHTIYKAENSIHLYPPLSEAVAMLSVG